ncbi:MAG TPA: DUF2298 domain-containing protein [Patescibacteria group bacterium]|nr:DUF2298 domain-containing protein [Patescibacteria group bacterium]
MPSQDFFIVLRWWGSLFLVGAVAYPLTKRLFAEWFDHGYFFSKAVGFAVVTWIVFVLSTIRLLPFTNTAIGFSLFTLFIVGVVLQIKATTQNVNLKVGSLIRSGMTDRRWVLIFVEELFFFFALLLWSWVKAHEPSIRGLEKFMDYGFMQSILNSSYFPPADMWYAGYPINYYYFGHMVVAVLTKLSGLDLAYTFNLMLATIFAMTLTMSFSIGVQLSAISYQRSAKLKALFSGILTALLVTLAGNLQTIYVFTRGYTGENVRPFWELTWPLVELWKRIPEGMQTYWYANATRFIPFTIHEFPSYSFVVSDIHGHVLSLPFVLLAIGMLIQLSVVSYQSSAWRKAESWKLMTIFYGFLVGILLMTNALDGPIYFGLLAVVLGVQGAKWKVQSWKTWGITISIVLIIAGITSLPFLVHFKSFVTGLAVNCPPKFFANSHFGPLLFEGVEKCQISPLWMWLLLWGFFLYCGGWLIMRNAQCQMIHAKLWYKKILVSIELTQTEKLLIVFFFFSLALVIFPEFFYFKDIYPAHFRSNTMFKLGYQAFVLFSIVSGYTIMSMIFRSSFFKEEKPQTPNPKPQTNFKFKILNTKRLFFLFFLPQLLLVSIFPIFAVRSYFGGLKKYEGIYGLGWLAREYPDDWRTIEWLKSQVKSEKWKVESGIAEPSSDSTLYAPDFTLSVLVEADGDSYTDYNHFSAFTGMPTIVGWAVHEWLWRGGYDVVSPRREEVRQIYESADLGQTQQILDKYHVRYIVVGALERQKFTNLDEEKILELGRPVFTSGLTVIYAVADGLQEAPIDK